jgi:hypothetical protein
MHSYKKHNIGLIYLIVALSLVSPVLAQDQSQSNSEIAFSPRTIRPGRDRFLNTPALTNDGLVETLKTNAAFRRHLAQHFGVSESRVVGFVQDALIPMELPEASAVMNYGVTKSGKIYGKRTVLKKGTRVWATRSQQAILKWDCSNPLIAKLPMPSLDAKTASIAMSRSAEAQVQSMAIDTSSPELPPLDAETAIPAQLASESPAVPVSTRPQVGVRVAGGGSRLPLLPIGAGVVGLALLTRNTSSATPDAVPEPGSLILCGLGLLGGALIRRRKR